jgi:glycosyltransferase involved in cell wall biosynthesis
VPKPFHVLSLIGSLGFGGAENRLLSIAQQINRQRFRHTVAVLDSMDSNREESSAMWHQYAQAGVAVLQISGVHGGRISRFAGRLQKLCEILEERQIDLIDCHCESASLLGTIAGVLMDRHRISTLYHPDPLHPPRFWNIAKEFILANSDLIISDSAVRGSEIQSAALTKRPEVAVIPNGISQSPTIRTREDVLKYLNVPVEANIRIVAQISALRDSKGHVILLDAAKLVLERHPSAFFLLLGYEKDAPGFEKQLKQYATELGIAERVRIRGYPGPIGDVWNLVDIHVHASLFDSLPNAIIEGMALGKPAVVTAVGGIPEAVINGGTGLIVPPGDSSRLASALLNLLDDPGFAARLGSAASRRYAQLYRPDLFIAKIESCFVEVITECSTTYALQKGSATALSS